jgi:hypothetical protein
MTIEELIGFFKNQDYKLAFQKLFLQDAFDRNEKPLNIDSIKEECNLDYYNLSLLNERMVLLPFKHWVEMHTSQTLIPQNICWISQVSLDIYPHRFVQMMNEATENIEFQENQLVCLLETTNIHGRVLFYFYSKEVNGINQFNAHLILVDSDFDFLVNDRGILNNTK